MARTDTLDNFLTDVANSIRIKKGTTEPIIASEFDTEIESIESNSATDVFIDDCTNLFSNSLRLNQLYNILNICKNVKNTKGMFKECSNLKSLDLSNFDTSAVTNMNEMFYNCLKLEELNLNGFDTSNVSDFSRMFFQCLNLLNLDVSSFDTSKATNMNSMFSNCKLLKSFDLNNFDTSNVTKMNSMFSGNERIKELNLSNFDISAVTDISGMFISCEGLQTLDLSNFDMKNIKSMSNFFYKCYSLTNFKSFINLGKGYTQNSNNYSSYKLDLTYSTLLNHESLMSIINNLYDLNLTYDVANGGTLYTQQLMIGATNLAKLTVEEIAIATSKGWNIS